MSKLLRLYNSWDQYSASDLEINDELLSRHSSASSSRTSRESFYADTNIKYAVEISKAQMFYGQGKRKFQVLREIDLNVPEGAIYALLGPSGCGKITHCNCITGRNRPSSGKVNVFGKTPGSSGSNIPGPIIGYMPQEISLFPDFTIEETLLFFSKLYRLDRDRAMERVNFLVDFLELPDKKRMVANLSGGQQRRVSLAAALIHSPPLLILDEPTVGVDPVLRQVIWDYLVLLSTKEKLTIIITTHYIEEARAANVCGLMRQGKLLVEESPDFLMEKYKCPTLEAVFLQLSRASDQSLNNSSSTQPSEIIVHGQGSGNKLRSSMKTQTHRVSNQSLAKINEQSGESELNASKPPTPTDDSKTANTVVAHRAPKMKDLAQDGNHHHQKHTSDNNAIDSDTKNNQDGINKLKKMGIETPSIEGIVNGKAVPKFEKFEIEVEPSTRFGAFKQETYNSLSRVGALTSKNFARLMRNLPVLLFQFLLPSVEVILFCLCIGQEPFNLPVAVYNGEGFEDTSLFSVRFLQEIDPHQVIQQRYNSTENALDSVRRGDAWGAIVLDDEFTTSLKMRVFNPENVNDSEISQGSVHLHLDMSNYLIGLQLQRTVLRTFQRFTGKALQDYNMSKSSADIPIVFEEPIYGLREPTFTEFMAPGVLLSIAFLAAVALTAIALVQERKEGSLERCLVAGVSSTEFIMSHVFTQLLVLHVQIFLLLIFTFLVFEIPSRGPFTWVVILTLMQSTCGMAFGLMISAMTREETSATMLALGSFYPNLLLSGTVWPTQAMPDAMRYFSYILPQTIPIESLRYILSRGWDITHIEVLAGFLVTNAWITFFLVAAVWIFKAKV
ncbi:ABC transporter G family member 23, partial [Fragariocoptes setiger]